MGGGAWPFLVGGAICLVNSVNERDLGLLNSRANPSAPRRFSGRGGGSPSGRGGEGFAPFSFTPRGDPGPSPFSAALRWGSRRRFLEGPRGTKRAEVRGNNRSVMPFRCSGPHARYTDELNERSIPAQAGRSGQSYSKLVVLGIDPCNCGSSTRNS